MVPDIVIKDYYRRYIKTLDRDLKLIDDKIEEINIKKGKYRKILLENHDRFLKGYHKDLAYIDEFKENKYIDGALMSFATSAIINKRQQVAVSKTVVRVLYNYAITLKKEIPIIKEREIIAKRRNIDYNYYKNCVYIYYRLVHKYILKGYKYQIPKVGEIFIARSTNGGIGDELRKKINWAESRKNKLQIIAEGKLPYLKADEDFCREHGITYEGVKYQVKNNKPNFTYIKFHQHHCYRGKRIVYEHPNNIPVKLKYYSHEQLAQIFRDKEDIYMAPLDLRVKVNILLINFPECIELYDTWDLYDKTYFKNKSNEKMRIAVATNKY